MNVIDKGDVWGWVGPTIDQLRWEDGSTAPLATDLVVMDFGKFKGWKLSEMDDVGYLQWLLKDAVDKDNGWQEACVRMRLQELNE